MTKLKVQKFIYLKQRDTDYIYICQNIGSFGNIKLDLKILFLGVLLFYNLN